MIFISILEKLIMKMLDKLNYNLNIDQYINPETKIDL